MKAFVITLLKVQESYDAAQKCIRSGAKHKVEIRLFSAIRPADEPAKMLRRNGVDPSPLLEGDNFRPMATFASHFELWRRCSQGDDPYLIMDHDAILEKQLPPVMFQYGIHICKGVYVINPPGAIYLMDEAKIAASPIKDFLQLLDV